MRIHAAAAALLIATGAGAAADHARPRASRPFFSVPTLTQIRDILAQLEAPIVSTLVQRFSLPANPSLYANGNASPLHKFLAGREEAAQALGRYDYGTLEYAYTLPVITPDVASSADAFPPGRFHQDTFTGNANISAFYTGTLVPLLSTSTTGFFFHLSNGSSTPDAQDTDAVLGIDVALLQLLSNRAHIGKVVAESKFAGNASLYTPLIHAQDSASIRTLLTNTTQETQVLLQADAAAVALATAWTAAGELVPSGFETTVRNATAKVFRELIDITTEIEIEYLLKRL